MCNDGNVISYELTKEGREYVESVSGAKEELTRRKNLMMLFSELSVSAFI